MTEMVFVECIDDSNFAVKPAPKKGRLYTVKGAGLYAGSQVFELHEFPQYVGADGKLWKRYWRQEHFKPADPGKPAANKTVKLYQ